MTNNTPDYGHVQLVAYKVLKKSGISTLPIDPDKIIDCIPNMHQISYQQLAGKMHVSVDYIVKYVGSQDEDLLYDAVKDRYVLLYNAEIRSPYRIRWSKSHGLGHYFLDHATRDLRTSIKATLPSDIYLVMEKEADYFAKRLLAPLPLVNSIMNLTEERTYLTNEPYISDYEVSQIFGLSHQASLNVLHNIGNLPFLPIDEELEDQFWTSIKAHVLAIELRRMRERAAII